MASTETKPLAKKEIKSMYSEEQLDKIDTKLNFLIDLERIVTAKLQELDNTTPNPAKVGMYMKFLDDFMESDNA